VVFVFCTKFGTNICYSHRERRTYPSEIHSMTLRELTPGLDFWSRGHLRMAVMHLPIKFGAYICTSPELLTLFEIQDPRWRQSPSWIFRLCEFLRHVNSVVFVLCTKCGSML